MQIISLGDNLHEMTKPIFWEKYCQLLSAELAQRVVKLFMLQMECTHNLVLGQKLYLKSNKNSKQ